MLAYWEFCHIYNFAKVRNLAYLGVKMYLESSLFRHIQAYLGIFNIDSHDNINFLFFTSILHTFQRNLKDTFVDYNDVNFNAWLNLIK